MLPVGEQSSSTISGIVSESTVSRAVLTNGITVLVDREPRFNSAACIVCVLGGLHGESEAKAGVTHALEHLLFKRTSSMDTREIAALIDSMGGEVNACTDADSFCLYGTVPKESLETLLGFFRDLLLDSAFTEADLKLEKEVIRQEILEAEDDPADAVLSCFYRTMWKESELGRPVFGTLKSVDSLDPDDVRGRLQQLCSGKRLLIAVSGDASLEEVSSWAQRYFGDLAPGDRDTDSKAVAHSGTNNVIRPVAQVHLAFGCPWPAQRHEQFLDGLLLASLLGNGVSSRLFQLLREEHGLVYDVRAEVEAYSHAAALLINAALEGRNVKTALTLIRGELTRLREDLQDGKDIHRVVQLHAAQFLMELDRVSSRAWRALECELAFGRHIGAAELLQQLRERTPESLRKAAEDWLSPDAYTLVVGGASKGLKPEKLLK